MASILFKWFITAFLLTGNAPVHPVYLSVTEIEHNAKEKTIEISCKIFTDDFEKTLRMASGKKIDLLNPAFRGTMGPIINNYIQQHLMLTADKKQLTLKFLGYEEQEEAIVSFFTVENINSVKELSVTDNLLYEYHEQQISLLHVTVNGNRKSYKLNNPEQSVVFRF